MRTTIELPAELHRLVSSLAQHSRRSWSATAVSLMQQGLSQGGHIAQPDIERRWFIDPHSGLPRVASTRVVTAEDVRALDDEA